MSIKRSFCVVLTLVFLALCSSTIAAELRGTFANGSGATVQVKCSPRPAVTATIDPDGNYTVRGLPASRNCDFVVSKDGASSVAIAFSTARSVTVYSGKLTLHGDRIVVIRQ